MRRVLQCEGRERRELRVTDTGANTYLWIGSPTGPCYGVTHGAVKMERLAREILRRLGKT